MMSRHPYNDDYDDPLGPASIYDGEDPAAPELTRPAHVSPLPRSERRALIDPQAWLNGEARGAGALARAAMEVGRLDAEVARFGPGAAARLAAREAEALSWAAGSPVPLDEIARDQMSARASTDLDGLQAARWAARRLEGQGDLADLRRFLGLHRGDTDAAPDRLRPRVTGALFDEAAAAFHAGFAGLDAHPITRGGFAMALWQLTDLSPDADLIEGATWAARTMAADCEALPFVPRGRGARVSAPGDLARHYAAVETAARHARHELSRVTHWAARARAQTAAIKGDSPARIIAVLCAHPQVTTQDVENGAAISRDTAERMLARMAAMGLVREITGATRFRLWTAKG